MMAFAVVTIVCALGFHSALGSGHWGYGFGDNGPAHWGHYATACDGTSQSPVNINKLSAQPTLSLNSLKFSDYKTTTGVQTLTNNGHSVSLSLDSTVVPKVSGAGLSGNYVFKQFHFHWGSNSKQGSEHTFNSQSYAAELHLVHWRESDGTYETAAATDKGLAVVGILLKKSLFDNPALNNLLESFESVKYNGQTTTQAKNVNLRDLLPGNTDCYYRYSGSLTTPTCSENVIWTVLSNSINVSERQLNKFRELFSNTEGEEEEKIVDNFRPVQPLNGRSISTPFFCQIRNHFSF